MITEEAFQNLKHGDRVRVVSEWPQHSCVYRDCDGEMDCWLGKVLTVDYVLNGYVLRCMENSWGWNRFCFDSVISAVEPVGVAELI